LKALAAKPAGKQHTIWDAVLPGFGVRVSGGGKLAFVVMRRPMGSKKPVRVTLGHYPAMTLDAARKAAQDALAELLAGKSPTEERKRRIRERAEADVHTFAGVAKRYLDHVADKRAVRQIRGIVERELIPRFDGRPVTSIRRREIAEMIDEIKNKRPGPGARRLGGEAAARQTLAYCKRIFRFAVARDLLDASPADAVSGEELIGVRKPRQRVLTDEQLRKVLTAFPWDTREGIVPSSPTHPRRSRPAAPGRVPRPGWLRLRPIRPRSPTGPPPALAPKCRTSPSSWIEGSWRWRPPPWPRWSCRRRAQRLSFSPPRSFPPSWRQRQPRGRFHEQHQRHAW
jgi:hypothetical protein